MSIEQIIITYIAFQSLIGGLICIGFHINLGYSIFNPIQLYENTRFNRFGSWCIAIFLWIIFIPWAVSYWIYKAFTVGG